MRPFGTLFDKLRGENVDSSESSHQQKDLPSSQRRLPVLIFPGFMSSALEVKKSPYDGSGKPGKGWVGNRVWLSVASAGFSKIYFGGALKANEDKRERGEEYDEDLHLEYQQEYECKSRWLQHFKLSDDLCSDPEGIETRALEGLEAVNFLDPGGLAKHASWVFSHVTKALLDAGYTEGVDLDAAAYDWRIPPSMLETRDSYFSRTMNKIEQMYEANDQTPVVLLCHSMGCKTCHYLLNFAKAKEGAGQAWIDKYVHTYFPVGAPHLGAPKSLRSTIVGDKMGLDAFFSEEECLIASRSFGSVPWMYSLYLPQGTPPTAYLRREGVIHVTVGAFDCIEMFRDRKTKHPKLKLAVTYKNCTLFSQYHEPEGNGCTIHFPETFTFAAPPELPFESSNETVRISLYEPGLHLDERVGSCSLLSAFVRGVVDIFFPAHCWRHIPLVKRHDVVSGAVEGAALAAANVATGALGSHTLVADSDEKNLSRDLTKSNNPIDFSLQLRFGNIQKIKRDLMARKTPRKEIVLGGTSSLPVSVQCRWQPTQHDVVTDRLTDVRVAVPSKKTVPPFIHSSEDKVPYEAVNGVQLLKSEYTPQYREILSNVYNADPLGPRTTSSSGAPPVKRVKAVYGINLPTEVGAVYRRRDIVQREGRVKCLHKVDPTARIDTMEYDLKDGLILETKRTPQLCLNGTDEGGSDEVICRSGDGTVPYFSLQQCRMWKDECDVTIDELPQADHREILADERFLKILLDYVTEPLPSCSSDNGARTT